MKRSQLNRKAKAHTQGWWQSKADTAMQHVHKTMFTNCMVCGGKNEVGHHFITKSLSSFLRYDFKNLIPLCFSCHFKHHIMSDPSISATLIEKNGQEWYLWIEKNRRNPIKTGVSYFKAKYEELTIILTNHEQPSLPKSTIPPKINSDKIIIR